MIHGCHRLSRNGEFVLTIGCEWTNSCVAACDALNRGGGRSRFLPRANVRQSPNSRVPSPSPVSKRNPSAVSPTEDLLFLYLCRDAAMRAVLMARTTPFLR